MKLFKAFNKDMTCRGFQYKEGETYHEDKAELCESGFHACENVLDCFDYYSPCESVYHEVELEEVSDKCDSDDTKRVGKTIKIGAALDVAGICKAHFEYVKEHCNPVYGRVAGDNESVSVGDKASASAGNYGSASAGESGSASAGFRGSASAGESGSAVSRGSASVAANGVAVTRGDRVRAKGGLGSVLVIAVENNYDCEIACWKAGVVDGEALKPDTWYTVKDGEFVEVEEND